MKLEQVVKRRIENNRKKISDLSGDELYEQEVGYIEEEIMLLQSILREANETVVEQQMDVELTLSVEVAISKENVKERILAFLGQSDGITTMAITVKEDGERDFRSLYSKRRKL